MTRIAIHTISRVITRPLLLVLLLLPLAPLTAQGAETDAIKERLAAYRAAGATNFDVAWAEKAWSEEHKADDGKMRSCVTCHTADFKAVGKHAKTGKAIDPLAPSVTPDRYTDAKKIEKWFKRNCEWAWGRECTPTEKGAFLLFLMNK